VTTDRDRCRWPKGRCGQPVAQMEKEGGKERLCFYHWKVSMGRFEPLWPKGNRALHVDPSARLSQEQQEIVNFLVNIAHRSPEEALRLVLKGAG
jgi:hypothetical protein